LPGTRALLLVAATDDGGHLAEVLGAAATLLGDEAPVVEALEPAVAAGLVAVGEGELRFRHPLVRSAIYQTASVSQRRAAHAAMAHILAEQPDRRVWHRAAATVGANEGVAVDLEEAATRAQRRGAIDVALAALERAAQLSVHCNGCEWRCSGSSSRPATMRRRLSFEPLLTWSIASDSPETLTSR
jgi:hypothetical protein